MSISSNISDQYKSTGEKEKLNLWSMLCSEALTSQLLQVINVFMVAMDTIVKILNYFEPSLMFRECAIVTLQSLAFLIQILLEKN